MIFLKKNNIQEFSVTLNELAVCEFQRLRWKFVFKLDEALGDDNYSVTIILEDINQGQNHWSNLFEIDSSIFTISGDYLYQVFQIDDNDDEVNLVEKGKMRIFDPNKINAEHLQNNNTFIYD